MSSSLLLATSTLASLASLLTDAKNRLSALDDSLYELAGADSLPAELADELASITEKIDVLAEQVGAVHSQYSS